MLDAKRLRNGTAKSYTRRKSVSPLLPYRIKPHNTLWNCEHPLAAIVTLIVSSHFPTVRTGIHRMCRWLPIKLPIWEQTTSGSRDRASQDKTRGSKRDAQGSGNGNRSPHRPVSRSRLSCHHDAHCVLRLRLPYSLFAVPSHAVHNILCCASKVWVK